MIRRWSAAVVVVGLSVAACSSEPVDEPPQGVDVARLTAEVNRSLAAVDQAGKVRAVLIYHDGAPVLEQYTRSTPADYWPVKSMTKAVTTALVGIAVQQGYLSGLDETLDEMLPSHAAAMTPDVAAITLRQLLTNTAGLPNEWAGHYDMWTSKDWVRTILADRVASGPGDGSFAYSHAGVHLLAAILTEATGQSLLDFARANLFDPLGIPTRPAFVEPIVVGKHPASQDPLTTREMALTPAFGADFAWLVDPQGINEGSYGLRLRPQDLAKLGQLYLDDGRWGNLQVVPASWVHQATTAQVGGLTQQDFPTQTQGFVGWWVTTAASTPAFLTYSWGGALLEVVPDRGLVLVMAVEYDPRDPLADHHALDATVGQDLVSNVVAPYFPSTSEASSPG